MRVSAQQTRQPAGSLSILGVPVFPGDLAAAVAQIHHWLDCGESRFVCVADAHNLVLARNEPVHMQALKRADMVTPDGMPLVVMGRLKGFSSIGRICGPDLLPALCDRSIAMGWRHYLYGAGEGVAGKLAQRLQSRFPGLRIAGYESPPYRPLTDEETEAACERIRRSGADIVWVGLGCPKQEAWMLHNAAEFPGAITIGIGAAFDIHAGRLPRAPVWMQSAGLEWLFRLCLEPRRLWSRYFRCIPEFLFAALREIVRERRRQR